MKILVLLGSAVFLSFLFTACAPQTVPEVEESVMPDLTDPTPAETRAPSPAATAAPEDTRTQEPPGVRFDPENPDWELRYQELVDLHLENFREPSPGQPVRLQLAAGREVTGILAEVTETGVVIDIGTGTVTYPFTSLTPETVETFSAMAYAQARAKTQGRREVRRWQLRQQAGATPTPLPRRSADSNIAARPGENGVDPVDLSTARGSVPKNEGPDGRVWQVDEYIRKNAAVPHSLRIKAWGQVQPHESGYKVRVQYTLQSAAGLGISNEDMMFFMNRNGRVYRRAPVK